MPTIPPGQARPPGPELHEYQQVARSFGVDPERYDRARPSYPQALIDRVVAASPGPEVLDVGCGTGIAARQFRAAGCRVLGVDPDPRMAEIARRSGLEVELAPFETWDSGGRSFDAVVAAQAWHWVDPADGAARAAGVLRPGGLLAVFWNAFQPPPHLAAAFTEVNQRVLPGSPFSGGSAAGAESYAPLSARAADGIRRAGQFGDPEQWEFGWDRSYSREEWLDFVPTAGVYSRLPPGKREELLAGHAAAIDAVGGEFTMRYAAVLVTAVRAGA